LLCAFNLRTGREKTVHLPHLIYNNLDLTKTFGDLLGINETLQLLYLLSGIKPGARMIIDERAYDVLHDSLLRLGIFTSRSDFYILAKSIRGAQYTYRRSSAPKGRKRDILIYVAPDIKYCASLKRSEAEADDYRLGKLLGYPACCLKHFSTTEHLKPGDDIMNSIRHPSFSFYPFLNNVSLWLFGIKILCHFPCRPDCASSLGLGKQYRRILKYIDKDYFHLLEGELKSLIICSRNGGIIYSTNYMINEQGVTIHQIKGDPRDPLYKAVKKHGVLDINSPTEFRINNKLYAWPESKIFIYN
jgi:hypothetical protein